jgi:hypothetical protein
MNMAKRKYSKMKKIEPSVHKLFFTSGEIGVDQLETFFIDLSQCASLVNRRFYRQGLNWAVGSIRLTTIPSDVDDIPRGYALVSKLPNTWVMSNAWEKSFRAWQHMIKNATDESGSQSIKGKFLDFKIYADAQHHNVGVDANLIPLQDVLGANGGAPFQYTRGQWQPSTVEIPETTTATGASTEYEFIAVGGSNPGAGASGLNAKSLIGGYEVSRALPSITDPNVPDDSASYAENWMLALFNDGTLQDSNVVDMLELTGDQPPYPFENDGANLDTMYPNGQNNVPWLEQHAVRPITGTTVGGETVISGGNFPCGLMRFDLYNEARPFTVYIEVDLVPGNHRGYLCEPMTEM